MSTNPTDDRRPHGLNGEPEDADRALVNCIRHIDASDDKTLSTSNDTHGEGKYLARDADIKRLLLKIKRATDVDSNCRVLLVDVKALVSRTQARLPARTNEIVTLLDGAVDVAIENKDMLRAEALFRKAADAFALSAGSGNQAIFFCGAFIGAFCMMILLIAALAVQEWSATTFFVQEMAEGPIVVGIIFFAVAGSLTSILVRLRKLDLSEEDDASMVFFTGAFQPIVAVGFTCAVYVILSSHLIPLDTATNTEVLKGFEYLGAFLCGFSEKFAPALLDRVGATVNDGGRDSAGGRKSPQKD